MIPIHRAKIIDSDNLIEGMLFSEHNRHNDCEDYFICEQGTLSVHFNATQIDEETLETSFDDGICFYKTSTIAELIKNELDDDYMA